MKTLRGLIDKVSWSPPRARIFFDGEVYTVPEGSNARAIGWLLPAREEGFPVTTLEVDHDSVIRAATSVTAGHTLALPLPSGKLTVSG